MKDLGVQERIKRSKDAQYNFDRLEMFEAVAIEAYPIKGSLPKMHWLVTRVPGGWIYQDFNPNSQYPSIVFVPKP